VIAEKYLSGEEITNDELMLGIRKATISLQFTGVIPGSAFKKKGVQRLLDCVVNYLPNPIDVPPMKGQDSDGKEVSATVERQVEARRTCVQAVERSVRRKTRLLPGVYWNGGQGHVPL
jgi:translation elongation factor EF-G